MNRTLGRFIPTLNSCLVKSKLFKSGCVIITHFVYFSILYMVSLAWLAHMSKRLLKGWMKVAMFICRDFPERGATSTFCYLFQVADVAIQMDFNKCFTVSPPQRKCLMKACAPFASILKSFPSGAVYECATKVYFLSSATAFAELSRKCPYHCELHTTQSEMDLHHQQLRLQFSH